MIPSREEVAALPEAAFRELFGHVMARSAARPHAGKRVDALMKLEVGDSVLMTGLASNSNFSTLYRRVRARLNAPDAAWKTRTTNQGLRVTRIR